MVRLKVEHLSREREAPPVWLWSSKTGAAPADVDLWWQVFLRRFDLEHTFRFTKQTLGWTTPKVRTPEAADRWTWLVIAAHTQLRLARPLAADLRRPWERPTTSDRLTPARVRRGFRNIRAHLPCPTRVPKPRGAGPGRPPGAKNKHRAPRYDALGTFCPRRSAPAVPTTAPALTPQAPPPQALAPLTATFLACRSAVPSTSAAVPTCHRCSSTQNPMTAKAS